MSRNLNWWLDKSLLSIAHPVLVNRRILYNFRRSVSDRLSSFGYYNYPYNIIFLAGMAMSASTWMKNLLSRIPGYFTRYEPMPKKVSYNQNICDSAFKHVPKHGYTLFKTHLNPTRENLECIFQNGVKKVIITYRDLRDVAIGRYHRMVEYAKPKNAHDFIDYRAMGKEKALDNSIEHVSDFYVNWIRGWIDIASQDPERYHFTKFEDLKKDTKGEFLKVLHFYGIELQDRKVDEIVEAAKGRGNIKKNMKEARVLPLGHSSNFRSGKIGNWKKEMTNIQIEKCKKLLGSALIELGYEKDLNW